MFQLTGRTLRIAILAAWVVAAFALPVRAVEAPTRYLALGDSLAWGDGASVPDQTGYTALLADYFAGVPHGGAKRAINASVRGETTASFIAGGQLATAVAAIADPSTDIRMITISIGGNDLLDLLNDPGDPCVQNPSSEACAFLVGSALAGVAERVPVILGTLSAALAEDPNGATIQVLTLYNPFGGTGSPFESAVDAGLLGGDLRVDCGALGNPLTVGLNDVVACTALAFGARVVDGYAVIGDRAVELTHISEPIFNIHPNDQGYALLARAHHDR